MMPSAIVVDGVDYASYKTTSKVLHSLSHSFKPSDNPPELEYVAQVERGRDVIVYVLERFYSNSDFPNDHGRSPTALQDTGKRADGTSNDKRELVKPLSSVGRHGAKVVSLLAGKKYGASQCAIIVVQRPQEHAVNGDGQVDAVPADYKKALDIVRNDFEQRKKKIHNCALHGVLSISVGFSYTAERAKALDKAISAGLVVVSAAGNDGEDWDAVPSDRLPERNPKVIVIGSLNQDGQRSHFSNFGDRVGFWVGGEDLDHADVFSPDTGYKFGRATGTSFATPIAAGVIACMLRAGQADYSEVPEMHDLPPYARVRAKLNEWAAVDNQGLKHLKNAPGLTLITPPGVLLPPAVSRPAVSDKEQLQSQRHLLAQLKEDFKIAPSKDRGEIRYRIEFLERDLHQLKNRCKTTKIND